MNDSSIHYDRNGNARSFSGPDAVQLFRAASLASGLGLLQKGIKPARGWTKRKALDWASAYTGRTYRLSEIDRARADLSVWVQTMKLALPSTQDA